MESTEAPSLRLPLKGSRRTISSRTVESGGATSPAALAVVLYAADVAWVLVTLPALPPAPSAASTPSSRGAKFGKFASLTSLT